MIRPSWITGLRLNPGRYQIAEGIVMDVTVTLDLSQVEDFILDKFGIKEVVHLMRIEHDLDQSCDCETCTEVQEIRSRYA